jgi:hypothetical protein
MTPVGGDDLARWRSNGTTDVLRWSIDGRPPTEAEVHELLAAVPADLTAVEPHHGYDGTTSKLDHDLAELGDLLHALTGVDGPLGDQLDAALDLEPTELDARIGELDSESQDVLAELVGSFPRVENRLPRLRMLANELHGDDCPHFAAAMSRHLERLLFLHASDEPVHWLEDRTLRF